MSPRRSQSGRDAAQARSTRLRDRDATTLDELVALVAPRLPNGLIGERGAGDVRAAAGGVPAELAARFGLECGLGQPIAGVGTALLFCADAETGGMQMLAGRHPLVSLPEALATADAWAPVVRLCRRREPGFLLHRATRDVWVDLGPRDAPSFSFGVRLGGLPEATRRPREVLIRALELGLDALRGAPLEPPALTSMRPLVRRLPATARVDRAGLIAGHPNGVQLWLSRLSGGELVDLVAATRDRGEARDLDAALADIVEPTGALRARIEVDEGVGRSIGLICGVDRTGPPSQVAARWGPLLDRLAGAGLCDSRQREALPACHGVLHERDAKVWPEHLTRLAAVFGEGAESVLQWHLHNVTVECDRGQAVHATAHVVVSYGWSRR
jgi:hypothetical protein